jgi:ATP-dependent RNA helicase SUPV3L1/SUV3
VCSSDLGIIPRGDVAQEVKALEQDARGALRKHGVRFGQFTIFMPLLLKPAPTRLRLVLWALAAGMDDFPEAPPPGLVTVPATRMPQGYYTMAGYRASGARAIRIDMLERLADMLRGEDSRAGFEAKADMLSITGMTLEQFADLMTGLGYKAERGERAKVKPVDQVMEEAPGVEPTPETVEDVVNRIEDEGVAPIAESSKEENEVRAEIPEISGTEVAPGTPADTHVAEAEPEIYYTFTWAGRARRSDAPEGRGKATAPDGREARGKPRGKGKPKGGKERGGKERGPQGGAAKSHSAGPAPRKDRIDPDNPFAAALMGLKTDK